ncbi:transporter [Seonamhaeicola sp. S2-3]|uniref:OmpP1/FadL family transporter n=1 Tax=Seonamhaeicola sp. S2-3 TaxID=1936081 RepID=UPI0009729534|nr:outer membrane protein transport protein [Seonamhaeicola sp. S2-3]APY11797.1 transporter [Seonamhaeicola sp. S2-3]
MKKINLLVIGLLSMSSIYAQDLTDALRYSQDNIQGTARFRALSGAFGALGGDMSAVSLNPASSAVFIRSHASISGTNVHSKNNSNYFGGSGSTNESNFDINQAGAAFVFASNTNSPWRKFSLAVAYERTNNHDDNWYAFGTNNTNDPNFSNSIASYFYDYADGKRLDEISAFPGESPSDAYRDIGNTYGFAHQQAFLGFESFILEPDDIDNDANTIYTSNIDPGTFMHDYSYIATGYNGKVSFNIATQYEDNLYLGLNLNSHFIDYQRSTLLFEENNNTGSTVNYVEFENALNTTGNGFSFQLGGIMKLTPEFRIGITYDSPTWYTIEEETSQYLATDGDNGFVEIYPQITNVYPQYKLQTPAQITGSLAYVFGKQGLISFDYSRKDYGSTKFKPENDAYYQDLNANISNTFTDASTYRLGGEYKHKQFSFRGGYRFEESPYTDGITVGDLNGYSFGLGYNFGNTKLDFTYDYAERSFINKLYHLDFGDAPQATVDRKNSNITVTLSFNI